MGCLLLTVVRAPNNRLVPKQEAHILVWSHWSSQKIIKKKSKFKKKIYVRSPMASSLYTLSSVCVCVCVYIIVAKTFIVSLLGSPVSTPVFLDLKHATLKLCACFTYSIITCLEKWKCYLKNFYHLILWNTQNKIMCLLYNLWGKLDQPGCELISLNLDESVTKN